MKTFGKLALMILLSVAFAIADHERVEASFVVSDSAQVEPVARWQWWQTFAQYRTGSVQLGHSMNSGGGGSFFILMPIQMPPAQPISKPINIKNTTALVSIAFLRTDILAFAPSRVNEDVWRVT